MLFEAEHLGITSLLVDPTGEETAFRSRWNPLCEAALSAEVELKHVSLPSRGEF